MTTSNNTSTTISEPVHILTYGGGINSSALYFYIIEHSLPLDLVVFADTGAESPTTYDAIRRMQQQCANDGKEFVAVKSKKGDMYQHYWNTKTIPTIIRRNCTTDFKIIPIRQYLRERYGKKAAFVMYVGIAWEEMHRMRDSDVNYIQNFYPLCYDKIDREGCIRILDKYGFTAVKSGCVGCIFNRKQVWLDMKRDNPKEFERWVLLEKNNKKYPYTFMNTRYRLADLKLTSDEEDVEHTCDIAGTCFI